MLRLLILALVALVGSWVLLFALAARLPAGPLRDLAGFLPACVTTARRLRRDPRVPRRAKLVVDDVVVVALALRYAARRVPRDVLLEAWPGKPELIERLLGSRR
ncbi:MAG: hypothetical protein LC792_28855 [Actinobacteria bacterium]|nr:hypothetical protein [Actinomycetota bacterium]